MKAHVSDPVSNPSQNGRAAAPPPVEQALIQMVCGSIRLSVSASESIRVVDVQARENEVRLLIFVRNE